MDPQGDKVVVNGHPEHLVKDDVGMDLKAHEQHADTLAACVAHDKPELDDRGCEKRVDPPKNKLH